MLFRDIVNNLSQNHDKAEATSGLSFYIRRLSKENKGRGIAAALVVTVMVFQIVTFLLPPKPSNAASPNDIMYGGFSSKAQALSRFDNRNPADIKVIWDFFGITRADVERSSVVTITGSMGLYSLGRNHHFADDQQLAIAGATTNIYSRPLGNWGAGARYTALKGVSSGTGQVFYIMYDCGNLTFPTRPATTSVFTGRITKLINTDAVSGVKEASVEVGKIFHYTIDVTNTGSTDMSDVGVADNAPAGVEFIPADSTSATQFFYKIPTLLHSETKHFSIAARANQLVSGSIENKACFFTAGAIGCDNANITVVQPVVTAKPTITPTSTVTARPTVTPTPTVTTKPTITPTPTVTARPTVTPTPTPPVPLSMPKLAYVKSADNLTQLVNGKPTDANNTTVRAGDRIRYNLIVNNSGGLDQTGYIFTEDISDILEYADIEDLGGALKSVKYNSTILNWTPVTVGAHAKQTKSFIVRVKDPMPDKTHSSTNPLSYDLKIDNVFEGQYVRVMLPTPPQKIVEDIVTTLPQTGADWPTALLAVLGAGATFLFLRNRLIKKELQIMSDHIEDYNG